MQSNNRISQLKEVTNKKERKKKRKRDSKDLGDIFRRNEKSHLSSEINNIGKMEI